jgi:hypothetical protein
MSFSKFGAIGSRFPHFAKAFPILRAPAADVPSFIFSPDLKTLPKRFGNACKCRFLFVSQIIVLSTQHKKIISII